MLSFCFDPAGHGDGQGQRSVSSSRFQSIYGSDGPLASVAGQYRRKVTVCSTQVVSDLYRLIERDL